MANKMVLELLADSNGLIKALETAQHAVKKFSDSAERAGGELGGSVNKALSSFAGLAEGGTVAAGVLAGALLAVSSAATIVAISAGKQAEELTQLSAILGANTTTLQDYDVLLNRVGLGGQDLTLVMKSLSQKMEEAKNGTGGAADRFRQLGIDITKVTGTDDLIRKIAESVSHFSNGTEKAAIMADLLGKSGLKFIPAFEGGAQAIDAAAVASERIGASLSGGQLAVLGSMDDAVDDLGLAWKRFGQQVGAVVAPAVQLITEGLTALLSMGSSAFKALDTAADTLAIRFSHVALAVNEVASQIFSSSVLSGDAWKQTAANLAMIDQEAARLIAKRRALNGLGSGDDSRSHAPALIDSAKVAASARSLADEQLKFSESLFKNESALADARLSHLLASLDSQKSALTATDMEIAQAHESAANQMAEFTVVSLETQIRNYSRFYATKAALFTADEKGQAEKTKFEFESSQKMVELLNQLEVAQIKSDTTRLQSATRTAEATRRLTIQPLDDAVEKYKALDQAQQAMFASERGMLGASDAARRVRLSLIEAEDARDRMRIDQTIQDAERKAQALRNIDELTDAKRRQAIQSFPTFFEQQMQSIVASNAFSVGQIITTWTGGVANAIVNHQEFVKAAMKSTEIAVIQGALNTGVQLAAQWALNASVEMGILTATEAAKLGLKTTSNATIVAGEAATATASVSIWGAASAAIVGAFATVGAGFAAVGTSMVGVLTAVGTFVMGVLSAIAEALTATVYGIPWAGAILLGIAAIAGALALTGNLGFKDGGIGNFGSGTPATLHGQEAIIPLNRRGASFMQDVMGGAAAGMPVIQVPVYLNGRQIAIAQSDDQISALRKMGVLA